MVAIWYINPVFYTKSTIDEDIEIDVIPFPKGIYFLQIQTENLKEKKIVIQ